MRSSASVLPGRGADMPLDGSTCTRVAWQRSLDPLRASFVLLARKRHAAPPRRCGVNGGAT